MTLRPSVPPESCRPPAPPPPSSRRAGYPGLMNGVVMMGRLQVRRYFGGMGPPKAERADSVPGQRTEAA